MRIGDICKIWNGDSSISDSKNWLIGIVVKKRKGRNRYWDKPRFQVRWNDLLTDDTWYEENDIRIDR